MAFRRRVKQDPRVELTPMVDVVFLLLIFFMISTTFIETQGLTIKLPKASLAQVDEQPDELLVYLSRDGDIFVQNQQVSLEQLQAQLQAFGARAKQTLFLLHADRDARHGQVVRLMDLAKQSGFAKLAIATEKPE